MTKQTIQTNLLGTKVIIGPESGTVSGPFADTAGKEGSIRNVYMEKDGNIKYTIHMDIDGKLHEFYSHAFRICPPSPYGD